MSSIPKESPHCRHKATQLFQNMKGQSVTASFSDMEVPAESKSDKRAEHRVDYVWFAGRINSSQQHLSSRRK